MNRYILQNGAWTPLRSDALQAVNAACTTNGQVLLTDTSATPLKYTGGFLFNPLSIVQTDDELSTQQTNNVNTGAVIIDVRTSSVYIYAGSAWGISSTATISDYTTVGLHYFNYTTGRLYFALATNVLVYIGNAGVATATDAEAIAGVSTTVAITSSQAKLAWQTWAAEE